MENLSITTYTPTDLDDVRRLHALSFQKLAVGGHSSEQILAHIDLIKSSAYGADVARSNLLCARDQDGELIATAGWLFMDGAPTTARIRKVFVHPGHAQSGIGRRMMGLVEHTAKLSGGEDFFVRANITAKGFYKRLGYSEIKPGTMEVGRGIKLPVMFMYKAQIPLAPAA